jgi:peptide/nickel transport system substrate-binding protein
MLTGTKSWQPSYLKLTRRRFLKGTAAGAGAIALIACGGGSDEGALEQTGDPREAGSVWFTSNDWKLEDESKQAVKGGVYRSYREEDQAGHYDIQSIPTSQAPTAAHVYEQFMGRNRGPGVDPSSQESGIPTPQLAESYEIAPDGTSVTFTMRPGVKFHNVAPVNGRVMDMDDWRTSFDRFRASNGDALRLKEVVASASYPDARHMTWHFNFPYAPLLDLIWHDAGLSFAVLPKELNASPQLAETTLIGTGYKMLDKHERGIKIEFKKNPEYWGGEPYIDRWTWPIIPEYSNQYAQFVNDNIIDFAPNARDVLLLAKDAPNTVIVADEIPDGRAPKMRFGQNNHKTLPWKDPRVRIAIRRSMDLAGIGAFVSNKAEFERNGIPVELQSSTHIPNKPTFWLDPEKGELGALSENYLFNLAEAKKLLSAAGFNSAIDMDYTVLPGGGGVVPEVEQLAIDSLVASGNFKLNVIRSANTVVHRNCRSLGQCDGIVVSGGGDDYDADRAIFRDYHSLGNTGGEQAYPDPRIDAVGEAQRREFDVAKRIQYIKDFQMLAAELFPLVPFEHQYTSFRFRWPYVHNHHTAPIGAGMPAGRIVAGSHKQWLDSQMPNRERGAS